MIFLNRNIKNKITKSLLLLYYTTSNLLLLILGEIIQLTPDVWHLKVGKIIQPSLVPLLNNKQNFWTRQFSEVQKLQKVHLQV
jgi:hypothetical protein